ncbi:BapA/Bap/LapF family prefix-like domain-containing protein, partial [Acinetobacter sp. MD2(2019)]|uniref:BapA/Bap/LapF family prefix-like domain-containing protein n=1 Tax=Acinetobacter sp. MD2(2019) TaxID=2605273 RepID=UPI002D1F8799
MTKFIVIDKSSLNKETVDTTQINLSKASIVHTKMHRDDVSEFLRDGNNLIMKLKNGEVVVIKDFFVVHDDVSSDLVFEENGCALFWFDGLSGFKDISGLEALLPEAGSHLAGLLPWIAGVGVLGGTIAAIGGGNKSKHGSGSDLQQGAIDLKIGKDGSLTGKTTDVKPGTDVVITVKGVDKDGQVVTETVKTVVKDDGTYSAQLPEGTKIVEGSPLVGESVSTDRNGNAVKGPGELAGAPGVSTPEDFPAHTPSEVGGGLDLQQ